MEKVIKDGKVALLISGTGWSTWNESDEMLYDPTIVNILMDDTLSRNAQCNRIVEHCEDKYDLPFLAGVVCY